MEEAIEAATYDAYQATGEEELRVDSGTPLVDLDGEGGISAEEYSDGA